MADLIERVEVFCIKIPRDTPYLGPLEEGNKPNDKGHFIRPGNRSVYSIHDHSVLVKVTTQSGIVGWGEGWGIVAPQIAATILEELAAPFVIGRDPHDVVAIFEDLYDAMRVRGFYGGFYIDALAALDIAIWDARGKIAELPICKLLGSARHMTMPAYVSGLPKPTRAERAALAKEWIDRGFDTIKFAAAVADEGEVAEIQSIREAVGPGPKIIVDMHWRNTAHEAIKLITAMKEYDLYVAEAPCNSEDIEGQAQVAQSVKTPIALGEELRTIYEFRPRFVNRCMSIIQPEVAHMGITSMWQVCQMAQAFHCRVMPHASMGIGIFQAASLQVAAALPNLVYHEYQHSIFDRNLSFVTGDMRCENGFYTVPDAPGLGVEPNDVVFKHIMK
jgi:L-alanine-DL-glutamate epimerase-like enolase superfamily enzyme